MEESLFRTLFHARLSQGSGRRFETGERKEHAEDNPQTLFKVPTVLPSRAKGGSFAHRPGQGATTTHLLGRNAGRKKGRDWVPQVVESPLCSIWGHPCFLTSGRSPSTPFPVVLPMLTFENSGTCLHAYTPTHLHARAREHAHARTCTRTGAGTQARTRERTHTRTRTHTHTHTLRHTGLRAYAALFG